MAKKFEASQSVWFVARVMGARKEEKETKNGNLYISYLSFNDQGILKIFSITF